MKTLKISIIIYFIVQFIGCVEGVEPVSGRKIAYYEYTGYYYYYKNTDTTKTGPTFLYHFSTKNDFDAKFMVIYDHFNPVLIPDSDFGKKHILAVVKVSNNYYTLGVKDLTLKGDVLYVNYNCELKAKDMTWTAAIPLVITTSESYNQIKFIENGVQVGEIGVED